MATIKQEIEKFNGMNDFNLWRKKVRALLVKEGLDSALEEASFSTSEGTTTLKSG